MHDARNLSILQWGLGSGSSSDTTAALRSRIHHARTKVSHWGSARRPRIHQARTLRFSLEPWEADHLARYTAAYLGPARHPTIYHAKTFGFLLRPAEMIIQRDTPRHTRVHASPYDTPCPGFRVFSGAWGADHPERGTVPHLGSTRRPRIHQAKTLGISSGGLGSGL